MSERNLESVTARIFGHSLARLREQVTRQPKQSPPRAPGSTCGRVKKNLRRFDRNTRVIAITYASKSAQVLFDGRPQVLPGLAGGGDLLGCRVTCSRSGQGECPKILAVTTLVPFRHDSAKAYWAVTYFSCGVRRKAYGAVTTLLHVTCSLA